MACSSSTSGPADEKLAQEMGVMELRNEEWARQVTNPRVSPVEQLH